MQVAIRKDGNRFVIIKAEGSMGLVANSQTLPLSTLLGLEIDPADVVFTRHWMIDRTYVDGDLVLVNCYHRYVLFLGSVNCVCFQGYHLFSTTGKRWSSVDNLSSNVSANLANVKFLLFHL